jgi:predicted MFS family arabinose efflux permease
MSEEKITPYHWLLFTICFLGAAFAGVISTLMSVYLPVAVKDLLGDKNPDELNTISAYINAVFIFGGAVGGLISGIIGDKAGRKASLIFAIGLYGICSILTGYMPRWEGVVVCRFFCGFGYSGVLVAGTTLMMEEWPPKTRAIFIGFMSMSIPIGIFSAGAINFIVASWRQGFLVGILPVAMATISIWVLRESKKWRYDRAATVDHSIKKETLFSSGHRADLIIGTVTFGTMLIGLWAIFSWVPTWLQGLITSGDGQRERGMSMMMLGMGGLVGGFVSGWLVNAMGLRKAMILCFAACTTISFILFKTNATFSPLIYAEIAALAFFFGASQGILSVYIPWLFPTGIRATATGFCFNIGRVVTAFAVLFVGVLVTSLGGYANALFIFSFVFVVGLIVTLLTKEKPDIIDEEVSDVTLAENQ